MFSPCGLIAALFPTGKAGIRQSGQMQAGERATHCQRFGWLAPRITLIIAPEPFRSPCRLFAPMSLPSFLATSPAHFKTQDQHEMRG